MHTLSELIIDEKKASAEYRKMSRLSRLKKNKATFLAMSKDEARHRKYLILMKFPKRVNVKGYIKR